MMTIQLSLEIFEQADQEILKTYLPARFYHNMTIQFSLENFEQADEKSKDMREPAEILKTHLATKFF